jgi:MipA family protein
LKSIRCWCAAALAASVTVAPWTVARADQPLWEAGGGVAGVALPDYRGSDEERTYLLPLPYFVYRGEILRVTRDGVQAQLLESRRFEFDISGGGSVPVDSERNRARAGMPDLRPTLEVGPLARIHLYRTADRVIGLELRLPVRATLTYGGDAGIRDIGWSSTPNLNLDWKPRAFGDRMNVGLLVGAVYGDRRLNGYFYDVPAEFATAARPAYRAGAGYGGWQAIAAVSHRTDKLWVGAFIKFDDLNGAVYADSPLVTRRRHLSGGFGLAYVFAQSRQRVDRD